MLGVRMTSFCGMSTLSSLVMRTPSSFSFKHHLPFILLEDGRRSNLGSCGE